MRFYKIVYPDAQGNPVEEELSEIDILDAYWDYWYEAMVRADKRHLVSIDRCIEDWVVVNWAWEVTDDS